jgi:hypothetical protein
MNTPAPHDDAPDGCDDLPAGPGDAPAGPDEPERQDGAKKGGYRPA